MKALQNAYSASTPSDIVIEYIKLYKKVGFSELYFEKLNKEYNLYRSLVIKDDVYYLFNTFFKDNKVSETRFNSLMSGKPGFVPSKKEEKIIVNLKKAIESIYHNNAQDEIKTNDLIDLDTLIFSGIEKNGFEFKKTQNLGKSYRLQLDELTNLYVKLKKEKKIEFSYLNLCFLVDFLKLSPFKEGNEIVGIVIYYTLSLLSDIKAYAHVSFFKIFYKYQEEYEKSLKIAYYHYDDGYPQLSDLLKLIIKIDNEAYDSLSTLYKNQEFDKNLSKTNAVIVTIYKLKELFTKEDIRKQMPNVSMSTIDRTLKQLQEEGKIRCYGRGRGSKWLRVDRSYEDKLKFLDNFKE